MKDRSRSRGKFANSYEREAFKLLRRLAASHASLQTAPAQGGSRASVSPVTEDIELRALNICHNYHLSQILRARSSIDRKSTRLNSSHVAISYAVFCLKKKTEEK